MSFQQNKTNKKQHRNHNGVESCSIQIIRAPTVKESELAAFVKGSLYGDEQFGELIQFQDWREY